MVISGLGKQCTLLSHLMIKDKRMIKYVNESARLHHDTVHTLVSERSGSLCDPFVNFLFTGLSRR